MLGMPPLNDLVHILSPLP